MSVASINMLLLKSRFKNHLTELNPPGLPSERTAQLQRAQGFHSIPLGDVQQHRLTIQLDVRSMIPTRPGKHTENDGQIPSMLLMGKLTINIQKKGWTNHDRSTILIHVSWENPRFRLGDVQVRLKLAIRLQADGDVSDTSDSPLETKGKSRNHNSPGKQNWKITMFNG